MTFPGGPSFVQVAQNLHTSPEEVTYIDMADALHRNQDYIPHGYHGYHPQISEGSGGTLPYCMSGGFTDTLSTTNPTYARSISVPRGSFSSDVTSVSRSREPRSPRGSGGSSTLPPKPAQRPHHLALIGKSHAIHFN